MTQGISCHFHMFHLILASILSPSTGRMKVGVLIEAGCRIAFTPISVFPHQETVSQCSVHLWTHANLP
jgi:hypothetical protein